MEIWLEAARTVPAVCWVLPAACGLYFAANFGALMRWVTPDTCSKMVIVAGIAAVFFSEFPPETTPILSRLLVVMLAATFTIIGVVLHIAAWLDGFTQQEE